jgi:uncharacterized protein (UPF0261 family)
MADVTQGGLGEPAVFAEAITPDDDDVITTSRALYIGGAGDVAVTMAGGGSVATFSAVPAGTILPIRVTKVMAATTATLILNLY